MNVNFRFNYYKKIYIWNNKYSTNKSYDSIEIRRNFESKKKRTLINYVHYVNNTDSDRSL